jgi:hypothetical protein
MKKNLSLMVAFLIIFVFGFQTVSAQFPIKIPKLKVDKPKQEQPKPVENRTNQDAPDQTQPKPQTGGSKKIYGYVPPPEKPVFIKDSLYIQASVSNARRFREVPKEKDYKIWVPTVRFNIFYDENKEVNYEAQYYNPDGSLWFSEPLTGMTDIASHSDNTNQMLKTKPSVGTGIYGIKINNKETGETIFQGKFKVGKFLPPGYKPYDVDFFVEHDWLLPFGYVGFPDSEFNGINDFGSFEVIVSAWLKGDFKLADVEARIFYKGQQIAVGTESWDVVKGPSSLFWGQRESRYAIYSPALHSWKLWNFQWKNFRFANGGTFNRDNYPNAHYADENRGEYTVKIYHKGAQVRELKFTVEADGRLNDGGFAKQMFLMHHKILVPVKVIGASEKWNATAWKTDAFYGNPLTGFTVQ